MAEQLFQLRDRNLTAVQVTDENHQAFILDSWFDLGIGDWVVSIGGAIHFAVCDKAFREHFVIPQSPWKPRSCEPHWMGAPFYDVTYSPHRIQETNS